MEIEKSTHEKLLELKTRLSKLELNGKISEKGRLSIVAHLEASLKNGSYEIAEHYNMTDDELVK
ncbi:MAG: hypothetical protein OEZ39_05535 [Gammaproteobacteria bacterium]|nr:hypothetical protein [Gammaproteobacteria bacterium]MDH5651317.1 hypothetical protein [Gammaproteobacteria bacterium]